MDHYLLTRHVMSGMAVSVVESRISRVRAMFSPVTILSADMEYTPAVKGRGSTVKGSVDSVKFRTGGKYIIAITYKLFLCTEKSNISFLTIYTSNMKICVLT